MTVVSNIVELTVQQYNTAAEKGEDPQCHKSARWLRPFQAPFGVLGLRGAPFGVFTIGGLRTSVRGEVLSIDGTPPPGRFAAGRTTSGIPAWGCRSGTSLGDATFFGRCAGRTAATA
ncbi:FAD-binding protein [Streptomyces sp. NPDC002911]